MKHTALLIISLLLSHCVMAQQTFRRRQCGTAMLMEREAAAYSKGQRAISKQNNYVPHTGTITIPVVLVNFKDVKFKINKPKEAFDQLFNSDTQANLGNGNRLNYGSVAKYFHDMSNGTFTPNFKVYDPVTVDSAETYYGGKNEDDSSDEHPRLLVEDALKLVEDQVKEDDIKSFCSDGKTIDCVYIVYAGLGQNDGGDGTTVWANCSTTGGKTLGGKSVRWYTMSPELSSMKLDDNGKFNNKGTIPAVSGIGVICHEFSHSLGLPDMYPTATSAYLNNQEMEYWDLMDGGEYTHAGFCPTAYTAFEKEQMGWPVDIKTLDSDASVTMTKSTEQHGTAYKIVNPQNDKEYLMLEYIQREGWNKHLFGNGLLVYHVCLPSETLDLDTRLNNDAHGYPGMAVVPADGACLSSYIKANKNDYIPSLYGDLFPGTGNLQGQNVTELSDTNKQPNFCWYNAAKNEKLNTNKAIKNIKYIKYDNDNGVLTFDYVHDVASGILPVWGDKQATDGRVYSINGAYLGDDITKLPHGIYLVNGQKIVK